MTSVRLERDGPVVRVTLARPERRNALDPELISALTEAFYAVGDARAVVLAGDGPSFCAGADVEWMRSSIDLSFEENVEDALRLRGLLDAIDGCPAPVVAQAHGHVLGGGCGLLAGCDVVVAGEGTVFGFTETKLGIVPAVISPFVLAKIGSSAARRYFVTGERFDAATALQIGLVHELANHADRVVAELLSSGPEAARIAKKLARRRHDADETARITAERRTSAEGQEGLRAFLEKREPSWRSRSSS